MAPGESNASPDEQKFNELEQTLEQFQVRLLQIE